MENYLDQLETAVLALPREKCLAFLMRLLAKLAEQDDLAVPVQPTEAN